MHRTYSLRGFERPVYLASPTDPVCLNFSITLFTADEVKSLFQPYFARNFQLLPLDFYYFWNIVLKTRYSTIFTNLKVSHVKCFFNTVAITLLHEWWSTLRSNLAFILKHPLYYEMGFLIKYRT